VSHIRTYIFPNGCLPSQQVMAREIARRTDMTTVHLEDLTPHYALTLKRWHESGTARRNPLTCVIPSPSPTTGCG